MSLEIFYKGETFKLEVDLSDSDGAPILFDELEDVSVVLEVNKKVVAALTVGDGISEGDEPSKMILDVSSENTAFWISGRLTGKFVFKIDGVTTIEEVIIYKVV